MAVQFPGDGQIYVSAKIELCSVSDIIYKSGNYLDNSDPVERLV